MKLSDNYKGIRRSNLRRKPPDVEGRDIRETVLKQCIVSGVILICLLLICAVRTDFTDSLRENLKFAISSKVSTDELSHASNGFKDLYSFLHNTVQTIFGSTQTDKNTKQNGALPVSNQQPPQSHVPTSANTEQTSEEDRIDEDILKELVMREGGDILKKSALPEETITQMHQ